MALSFRILRRRARRGLWNERAAARYIRSDAALVGATLSCDPASVLSSCQHHWNGRVLARRPVDSRCHSLLFALIACDSTSGVPRKYHQSPPAWRCFLEIRLSRPGSGWVAFVGAGYYWPLLIQPTRVHRFACLNRAASLRHPTSEIGRGVDELLKENRG